MTLRVFRAAAALLTLALAGCAANPAPKLHDILDRQAEAWNRGDIDGFMAHYWKSEQLTFSSGGHVEHGWQQTRDRYVRRYPTPERMGRLRFDLDDCRALGPDAVLVLGRFHLDRAGDPLDGCFTLVFRRLGGRWVIVHDHTSAAEKAAAAPQ